MMTKQDVGEYFRDLFYLEEHVLDQLKLADLPQKIREQIQDNILEKQVIITKLLNLILVDSPDV